ncbi:HtpX family heat shock protein [Proteus hauseri ATCC 700826]|uniref:HtpX family heat shock protein n=1 Tax=Proteus hauseri ATCC 700826 TaxID=1354271 RepID=A0AAJ3HUL4_PROHU|nr:zinc metalloprotease HtpX [Proteus hauseri]OAT48634.1 HtpX family heat shock protein [Proteus hauseri ATCC 700826]
MDFRNVLRKNTIRTRFVIATYLLLMLIIGLLVDTAIGADPRLDLVDNMLAFLTFQSLPIASFIILAISIILLIIIHFKGHKIMLTGMNARLISPDETHNAQERQLLNIVEELSLSATLGYIPKLYIIDTSEANAFAAGWSAKNAIIGVTTGLLNRLNRQEIQAVLAHETGHIIHGDSRLTLYVGILANVILTVTNIFGSRFYIASNSRGKSNDAASKARLILIILNLVLPIITQVLYFYLSRTREYMADAAAVDLTQDNQAMINALKKISAQHETENFEDGSTGRAYRKAAFIFNKGDSIFSTHPSIENRIAALEGRKTF